MLRVIATKIRAAAAPNCSTYRRSAIHTRCLSTTNTSTTTSNPPLSPQLSIAVVGSGRMGQIRLATIQRDPRLHIAAIVDPHTINRHDLEQHYDTRIYRTLQDAAAAHSTLDGVWIATPTPSHVATIHDALATVTNLQAIGIEKPVGRSVEEIDDAYISCRKRNVRLVCSFQRRFDPSYEALRTAIVEENALGPLQSIHTVFRDHPCPPIEFLQVGGDPFHDLAVHDIDYVCSVVGEYPTRVYASGSSLSPLLKEAGVMDKASVWLEFPLSGVVCTMDLSRNASYGYDQRVEVAGERGMLQVLNPPRTNVVRSDATGVTSDVLVHSFPQRFDAAYKLEMDHFVDVLRGDAVPRVHWNAARMATIVSEAARIAAVKKKIVTLKLDKTRQVSPRSEPIFDVEFVY